MAKTFLYRLFGIGKVPLEVEKKLHEEKLIYAEEGISITLVFEHYRAPGKRFRNKVSRFSGYLCITEKGMHSPRCGRVSANFEWNDPRLPSLILGTQNDFFKVRFESNIFDNKAEGMVEFRFKCENPESILNLVEELIDRSRS